MTPICSDRDTFLLRLRHSGLLSAGQLRETIDRLGHAVTPIDLARALMRCGWLTRFQARMLLHGRTNGFFLGPYRILEQVGHGGMGKVYKALHETMNRTVALKVLAPALMKTAKARAMFRNEVQTAAQLNHPNIVHAYDSSAIAGRHFLAMEFIAGVTLSQLVDQRGPLPIGLACEIIRQAALGLQHAHEKGLVHRDIKPANLMASVVRHPHAAGGVARLSRPKQATSELQVKILDFGLARLQRRREVADDSDAGRHPITGTPDYMSPEQARNRNAVDIRSDLYSLGCTFYYLLTAQVPFPGGGMLDKLIRHNSELPAAPELVRPRIPPAVATIVLRLIAKEPADRFQIPQELVDALAPHAAVPSLEQARELRRRRASSRLETATPPANEKTLGLDREDTPPHGCAPTIVNDEQEALSSWVAGQIDQRRQTRRRLSWAAATALGIAGGVAAWRWFQPW
jgi:eukaryotic-like serine/threonine-protein kinase